MANLLQAAGADAVDAFCEGIAFSVEETRGVFAAAKALGLPVKLHAEQLSNLGGSAMAAEFGALSVDHIEYLDQEGVEAIARAGTVAVLLPGAFYYLRVARVMYFEDPVDDAPLTPRAGMHWLLSSNGLAILVLGLAPGPLMALCESSIQLSLLHP